MIYIMAFFIASLNPYDLLFQNVYPDGKYYKSSALVQNLASMLANTHFCFTPNFTCIEQCEHIQSVCDSFQVYVLCVCMFECRCFCVCMLNEMYNITGDKSPFFRPYLKFIYFLSQYCFFSGVGKGRGYMGGRGKSASITNKMG